MFRGSNHRLKVLRRRVSARAKRAPLQRSCVVAEQLQHTAAAHSCSAAAAQLQHSCSAAAAGCLGDQITGLKCSVGGFLCERSEHRRSAAALQRSCSAAQLQRSAAVAQLQHSSAATQLQRSCSTAAAQLQRKPGSPEGRMTESPKDRNVIFRPDVVFRERVAK
jgi:hypothetical protein